MVPSPATASISSRSSASKLLTPHERILPELTSCSNAATVSASGYDPRQCKRQQSSRSVFSRFSERSHAVMVPRRVARQYFRHKENLVALPGDRVSDHQLGIAIHLGGVDVDHAEIDATAQRGDRGLAIAMVDVPGALPDHGHLRTALAEFFLSHDYLAETGSPRRSRSPQRRIQNTDIRDQHGAGRRFRHVETVAIWTADGDIGAACPCAGLDACNQ